MAQPKTTEAAPNRSNVLLQQSNLILIENLPELSVPHSKILEELLKNYPGVDRIVSSEASSAVISFNSPDSAKFAVMGLNRFKVDQSGRQLRVTFKTD